MAGKKYTQCYAYTPGNEPFNEDDLGALAVVHGILPGVFFSALAGLALGFLGGPPGAIVGIFLGLTVGWANALTEASVKWRFHRLICLTGERCAVGTVRLGPNTGELGDFDNDEFFDLLLMPHRPQDDYVKASANYKATPPKPGVVADDQQPHLDAHPRNDLYIDGFQGEALLRPRDDLDNDLGYNTETEAPEEFHTSSGLHCEAEGDFWVRISDLASALGALLALLTMVTVGGTAAGAAAGAAAGCEIGGVFGPIGCFIGAILGAILGGLLVGGAFAGLSYLIVSAILNAIFDADPGDIEDANVGDVALGPIVDGDRVAVRGEHVYDGFHEGWHELHPLLTVVKLGADAPYYLQWNPTFGDADPLPADLPDMPTSPAQDVTKLTVDDMRQGLNSEKFRRRAIWLRDKWCRMLTEAADGNVKTRQQGLAERWTIHPFIDGCTPQDPDPGPGLIH